MYWSERFKRCHAQIYPLGFILDMCCCKSNERKRSNFLLDDGNISTHIFAILFLYTCIFKPGRLICRGLITTLIKWKLHLPGITLLLSGIWFVSLTDNNKERKQISAGDFDNGNELRWLNMLKAVNWSVFIYLNKCAPEVDEPVYNYIVFSKLKNFEEESCSICFFKQDKSPSKKNHDRITCW